MWLIGLKLTKKLITDFYCTTDLNYVLKVGTVLPRASCLGGGLYFIVVKHKIYNTVKCAKAERI